MGLVISSHALDKLAFCLPVDLVYHIVNVILNVSNTDRA